MDAPNKNFPFAALSAWAVGMVAAVASEPVRLNIDEDASRIYADVKATGHRFEAVVTEFTLDLRWDADDERVTSARLEFDFDAVKTGRDRRDREMLEWLDHDNHPAAVFVLEELEPDGDRLVARGTLAFHDVEKEVEFPLTLRQEDRSLRITAQTELDHRDWNLEVIRTMLFMTVDPVLVIRIDIHAELP
jgi:polyisoprenoid-binding protein YceI